MCSAIELSVSPDWTVYLSTVELCFAAGLMTAAVLTTAAGRARPAASPVHWTAAVAAGCCTGVCTADALAAGAYARANAAATPKSAGAVMPAAVRRARRMVPGLRCLPGLPKGLLPAEVALTRKAACASGAPVVHGGTGSLRNALHHGSVS